MEFLLGGFFRNLSNPSDFSGNAYHHKADVEASIVSLLLFNIIARFTTFGGTSTYRFQIPCWLAFLFRSFRGHADKIY